MSYIEIIKNEDGITMKLTAEGREELESYIGGAGDAAGRWIDGPDQIFSNLLEDHLCNGWEFILPEEIGALTSANILSDEVTRDDHGNITEIGNVYWFPDYALRLEIDDLYETGEVFFPAAKEVANA